MKPGPKEDTLKIERYKNQIRHIKRIQQDWMMTAVRRGKTIEKLNKLVRNCGDLMTNGLAEKCDAILDEYERQSQPTLAENPENYEVRSRHRRQKS